MGKLICPRCGAFTSATPSVFSGSVLLKSYDRFWHEEGSAQAITPYSPGEPTYGIMVCQSCEKRFVAEETRGEWLAVYPIQYKPVAKEIPEPIRSEFQEAYLCFAIGAHRACVAICGVALEALWNQKNVSGLNELREEGIISQRLFDQGTEIRLWAGMVKHVPIHDSVTKEETEQLLTYLEAILDAVYVQPARLAALAEKREQVKKTT